MTTKAQSIILNGQLVVQLPEGGIYAVKESRGYQTDYKHKTFFYFVYSPRSKPVGITNDPRRHTMQEFWEEKKIPYRIVNQKLYEDLLAR